MYEKVYGVPPEEDEDDEDEDEVVREGILIQITEIEREVEAEEDDGDKPIWSA
ncbi:hypothetical protein D3C87_2166910 [compost metagenome]